MSESITAYRKILDLNNEIQLVEARFQREVEELASFKQYLVENRELFSNYKKAKGEILTCLDEDNRVAVRQNIENLRKVDCRIAEIKESIDAIKDYCNRHNKKETEKLFFDTVNEMHNTMCLAEVEKYMSKLAEIEKSIQGVANAFQNEYDELLAIKKKLENNSPPKVWKDDRDRLLSAVLVVLEKDVRKMDFDLGELKAGIEEVTAIRKRDIQDTLDKYSWLTEGEYKESFKAIASKNLSFAEYQTKIDELVSARTGGKTWKYIGVVLLLLSLIAGLLSGC